MSRSKEAEKIKLEKMERLLSDEKEELEKMKKLADSLDGEEKEMMYEKINEKKIKITLLKNDIVRQKNKINEMN